MPFCPSCKYEYRPEIKRCPDCDVELVDRLAADPRSSTDPVELVRAASYPFEVEAQEARLRLDSHGIRAVVANEKMAQTDMILAFADGGVHILVRQEDAARARKILEGQEDE